MKLVSLAAAMFAASTALAQPIDIGPAPGRMVDVGGRTLHIACTGSRSPTVLLEAGASAFALDWSLVQPEIAKTNRVCAYDRAGSGWSGPRSNVETPARIVEDLHALLKAAGETGPFVLVGASAGAIYARLYQLQYPQEVAGMVLVDPSNEDVLFTMFEGRAVAIASLTAEQFATTLPRSGSVAVPTRGPQTGVPFDLLPAPLYALRIKLDQRLIASMPPTVSADVVREYSEGQRAALALLLQSRSLMPPTLGERPLVVLTRSLDSAPGLTESHIALARLSTNARHTVVPNAGHEIHLFAPAAVVQAIRDVATAIRQRGPL